MADIAIVGGHGKVALLAAPLLREAGHQVHSLIRNPDHVAEIEATGTHPVVADVERLDTRGLGDVLRGRDTVVWSAGAGGGDAGRTYAVDRDAAIRTMDAAAHVGVRRFVMVSYFGAGPEHGVDPENDFFAYAQAKSIADGHLATTGLAWTLLRPGALTDDDPTGRIVVGGDPSGSVSRADVAATIVATLAEPRSVGRVYEFNNGDVEIAQALADHGWKPARPEQVGPTPG